MKVVFKVQYENRKPFFVDSYKFTVDDDPCWDLYLITAQAKKLLKEFFEDHFPSGTPIPSIISLNAGYFGFVKQGEEIVL